MSLYEETDGSSASFTNRDDHTLTNENTLTPSSANPIKQRKILNQDTVYITSPIKATIGSWERQVGEDGGTANVLTLTKNSVFKVIRSGDEMGDDLWCLELLDVFNTDSHLPQREREHNIFFLHKNNRNQQTPQLKLTNSRLINYSNKSSTVPSYEQSPSSPTTTEKYQQKYVHHTLMGSVSFNCGVCLLRNIDLPDDISRHILSFLTVSHLNPNDVSVSSASSTRGHFPISSVLGNDKTWWLSAKGTMHNDACEEYLEFQLSSDSSITRLSYVGVSIPPLPHGPVSVRYFRIDSSIDGKRWKKGGKEYQLETMDLSGIQTFKLCQPIDVAFVRIVCLQNAFAAEHVYISGMSPFDCIGLFHVRFK